MKEIRNALLDEKYYEIEHASGLKILVMPKPGYHTVYALFGTDFGSADMHFSLDGQEVILPAGTAHFLEHKLFESEEKDAFELFAATGARANAYTSFEKTCYLFSCSENFYQNLETLLGFVQEPYFTEQTIAKEQGIIGQEIKMYRDNPGWQSVFELFRALYHHYGINTDIAGSVESIAAITPQMLYSAYEAFYRPENMILSICGDVDVQKILAICDRCIKAAPQSAVQRIAPKEPLPPVTGKTLKRMPVSVPLYAFGYKEEVSGRVSIKERIETILLNQILIGPMSPLYQSLLEEGCMNEEFGSEYFTGRNNAFVFFSGTGEKGEYIKEQFEAEVERVRREGIEKELYDCVIKDMYGTIIKDFNAVEDIATDMLESALDGCGYFDEFEAFSSITIDSLQERLATKYALSRAAISLILPLE